jgi:hypothetical protein
VQYAYVTTGEVSESRVFIFSNCQRQWTLCGSNSILRGSVSYRSAVPSFTRTGM